VAILGVIDDHGHSAEQTGDNSDNTNKADVPRAFAYLAGSVQEDARHGRASL